MELTGSVNEPVGARLEPVPHGGHFIVVPSDVAAAAHVTHGARVRGTINGVAYRSSLMKYSGVFHLGIHKATVRAAGVARGDRVEVTIEIDDQPLPTDVLPGDLARALARDKKASAAHVDTFALSGRPRAGKAQ
jgi:hypothetical protein